MKMLVKAEKYNSLFLLPYLWLNEMTKKENNKKILKPDTTYNILKHAHQVHTYTPIHIYTLM